MLNLLPLIKCILKLFEKLVVFCIGHKLHILFSLTLFFFKLLDKVLGLLAFLVRGGTIDGQGLLPTRVVDKRPVGEGGSFLGLATPWQRRKA